MDYTTIIVAGLSLIGTLVGSFLANSKGTALVAYRLEELERKVQKHNNLVERMAILERDVRQLGTEVTEEEKQIEKLKEDNHHE